MKIVSRPDQNELDEMFGIGNGENVLRLTDEQFELICALVYSCRLGSSTPYSDAAFDISAMIEAELGSDTMDEAYQAVDLQVTIEDSNGSVIFETEPSHIINIEV